MFFFKKNTFDFCRSRKLTARLFQLKIDNCIGRRKEKKIKYKKGNKIN